MRRRDFLKGVAAIAGLAAVPMAGKAVASKAKQGPVMLGSYGSGWSKAIKVTACDWKLGQLVTIQGVTYTVIEIENPGTLFLDRPFEVACHIGDEIGLCLPCEPYAVDIEAMSWAPTGIHPPYQKKYTRRVQLQDSEITFRDKSGEVVRVRLGDGDLTWNDLPNEYLKEASRKMSESIDRAILGRVATCLK